MDTTTSTSQPPSAVRDIPPFSSVPRDASIGDATGGAALLAVAFGAGGLKEAGEFLAGAALPGSTSLHAAPAATPAILGQLQRDLGLAMVGVRILLAGPEADVYAARAVALGSGAVDSELLLRVTGASERRVYCPHCAATTTAEVGIGGILDCSGCSRSLAVYHHFSRSTARYLGFMADAEDARSPAMDVAA